MTRLFPSYDIITTLPVYSISYIGGFSSTTNLLNGLVIQILLCFALISFLKKKNKQTFFSFLLFHINIFMYVPTSLRRIFNS